MIRDDLYKMCNGLVYMFSKEGKNILLSYYYGLLRGYFLGIGIGND